MISFSSPSAQSSLPLPPPSKVVLGVLDDVWASHQTVIAVSGALLVSVLVLLAVLVVVYRRQVVRKDRFSRQEQQWLNQFRDFCENVPGMLFQYRQRLTPFDANYRVNHPVYGRRWMRGRATPSNDDDGVTWHGYVQDVTDLKAFEAQRQLAASALETVQEGILISDEKHRIIKVNRACTQLLGYEAEEILGKPASLIMFETDREELAPRLIQELDQRSGAWKGQIRCRTKNGGTLPVELSIATVKTEELESIHHVGVFRDMREQLQQEAELKRLATHDALTGLPNRRLLTDRLQQAMAHAERTGERFAVGVLDLDGFKPVNDQNGHEAGDQVLVEVAKRLNATVRAIDTVARLGGDEFVVVLRNFSGEEAFKCLLASLNKPIRLDRFGVEVQAKGSLGVALFDPANPLDGDQLLRQADQAAYRVKNNGGGHWAIFGPQRGETHDHRDA